MSYEAGFDSFKESKDKISNTPDKKINC